MTPLAVHLDSVRDRVMDARNAVEVRDESIRRAHEAGATIRVIAAVANLSPARVHQIIHAERES